MQKNRQQTTPRGIAQQSGLDTFSSIINYTGEFVNWGDFFAYGSQLNSDTDYESVDAEPQFEALMKSPASVSNQWYRYHTEGTTFTTTTAPTISSGIVAFNGRKIGTTLSYSGMYQKLSGLTVGKEYEISVQTAISASSANMYIQTYSPTGVGSNAAGYTFNLDSSHSFTFPKSSSSTGIEKTTFTAKTVSDIILIYINATDATQNNISVYITGVSIKEQQSYLVPLYGTDIYGNAHKILRRQGEQTIA